MANGRVITGYSFPRVARYNFLGGAVTYTNGMPLARGVDVNIEPETGDVEDFYADNVAAESAGGVFTGGTATLTLDSPKAETRSLIMGLPAPDTMEVGGQNVTVYKYDDRQAIPYVGIGFVVRLMENGVSYFRPVVLTKCIFNQEGLSAATQEESIDFQPGELEANILRDDTTNHMWKIEGEDMTTEAEALAVVDAILNVTTSI